MRFQVPCGSLAAVSVAFALGLFLGCRSQDAYLDEHEKAKRLQVLRKKADDALARFVASNEDPKGADLDALLEYAELEGATTKLLPRGCPSCYSRYALALRRVGRYYETLALAYEQEAARASPAERGKLEAKAGDSRKRMLEYLAESRRQFENYITTSRGDGQWVDPEAYREIFEISDQLKDFRRALYYLDLYTANVVLTEQDKRNAERLRESYVRELAREEEEKLRRALKEGGG